MSTVAPTIDVNVGVVGVRLDRIHPSKANPRKTFDKDYMDDLAASIKEKGILVPLLLRPDGNDFEIVAGERRYRAAKTLKLVEVPAIVRTMTDEEAKEAQLIENLQRADLHPMEEAEGYKNLGDLSVEQIATKVGKSASYITKRLQLNFLIEPIKKLFLELKISTQHAFIAARLTPEQQKEAVAWLKRGDSAQGFHSEVQRHFFLNLKEAPFNTDDEKLVPKAGSCTNCPKRTGFNKALFEEIKAADICTDPACFENKVRSFIKIQMGTHKNAVLLSISAGQYNNQQPPKHLAEWVKAGDQNCPDTKEGLVMEQVSFRAPVNQEARIGQVLKVCTNPKCKTHHPPEARVKSDYNPQTGQSRKAEKARKIELRRRGMIFKELASNPFPVSEADYRSVLDHQIRALSHDHAKSVVGAMQWPVEAAKKGDVTYQDLVAKNLSKLNARAVVQWILLLTVAEAELWFYSGSTNNKAKLLEAKGKAEGVPLNEIAKKAKETKAEERKRTKADMKKVVDASGKHRIKEAAKASKTKTS